MIKKRIGPRGPFLQPQPPFAQGGGFYAFTDAITAGFTSAQSEAGGWNAKVRDALKIDWVRTSDTVATGTLQAAADYDITAQETITGTIPGSILTGGSPLVATPTFTISPMTYAPPPFNHSMFLNNLMRF